LLLVIKMGGELRLSLLFCFVVVFVVCMYQKGWERK